MYDDEELQAVSEGSYWFCLNDLSYYVQQFGLVKVLKDLKELQDNQKLVAESAANKNQKLDDIPF